MPNSFSPIASLPPLNRLSSYSPIDVTDALENLRGLYFPSQQLIESLQLRKNSKPPRLVHDNSVPDSGYASAEENGDDDAVSEGEDDVSHEFERAFAIRWLIGFTARSDSWISSIDESEAVVCACAIDEAVSLLALFTSLEPEQEITRSFSFPFRHGHGVPVQVVLNDAPLVDEDHTSVGLQSWASSVLLAERICANPSKFGLEETATARGESLRVLELGAGTGLLSITAARILARVPVRTPPLIVATDFHLDVLANLQRNVDTNEGAGDVLVRELDWSRPNLDDAPLDQAFDVILAADVVYEPSHASLIANCATALLARPAGVLWMIIALRTGGKHEGLSSTVTEAFSRGNSGTKLTILEEEILRRIDGHGRADEVGYKLFKIGWTQEQS